MPSAEYASAPPSCYAHRYVVSALKKSVVYPGVSRNASLLKSHSS